MNRLHTSLLAVAFIVSAQAATAGTQASPEITDPEYDQKLTSGQSACAGPAPTGCIYIPVDVWNAWVTQTEMDLHFKIELAQAPPSSFGTVTYTFHFKVTDATTNGTDFEAAGIVNQASPGGDGAIAPGGVATAASLEGTVLDLTVPLAAVNATAGMVLRGLQVVSSATAAASDQEGATDTAPDTGFGANYTLPSPPENTTQTTSSTGAPTSNVTAPPSNSTSQDSTTKKAPSVPLQTVAALVLAACVHRRRSALRARNP